MNSQPQPAGETQHPHNAMTLSHTGTTTGFTPIPASERDLSCATAEPYFKVSDDRISLEGPAFDRQGNLLFVEIYGERLLRLSREGQLTVVFTEKPEPYRRCNSRFDAVVSNQPSLTAKASVPEVCTSPSYERTV